MADMRLLFSFLIFTLVFNSLLGLYLANNDELAQVEAPHYDSALSFLNLPGVIYDYGGFVLNLASVSFSVVPAWVGFLFVAINIVTIGIVIDLIWIG